MRDFLTSIMQRAIHVDLVRQSGYSNTIGCDISLVGLNANQ